MNMEEATIRIPGTHGTAGCDGTHGENGVQPADPNGKNGSCKSGFFGTSCTCSESGKPGGNAPTPGYRGVNGHCGGDAPAFTLRAGTISGPLVIFSRGGDGGDGGTGGDGGAGAAGGNAGQFDDTCAKKCLDGRCRFATGGKGGFGSAAGDGGDGGLGGNGGPITVIYDRLEGQLVPQSQGGRGGGFGSPGKRGLGGMGGKNEIFPGTAQSFAPSGDDGCAGEAGDPGESGENGSVTVLQRTA